VNISRTAEATGFKFITQVECKELKISSTKLGQKGHNLGHNDLVLDFGISFIFLYCLQLQTSSLVPTLPMGSTIKECKTRSQGSKPGHVATF